MGKLLNDHSVKTTALFLSALFALTGCLPEKQMAKKSSQQSTNDQNTIPSGFGNPIVVNPMPGATSTPVPNPTASPVPTPAPTPTVSATPVPPNSSVPTVNQRLAMVMNSARGIKIFNLSNLYSTSNVTNQARMDLVSRDPLFNRLADDGEVEVVGTVGLAGVYTLPLAVAQAVNYPGLGNQTSIINSVGVQTGLYCADPVTGAYSVCSLYPGDLLGMVRNLVINNGPQFIQSYQLYVRATDSYGYLPGAEFRLTSSNPNAVTVQTSIKVQTTVPESQAQQSLVYNLTLNGGKGLAACDPNGNNCVCTTVSNLKLEIRASSDGVAGDDIWVPLRDITACVY